MTETVDGTMKLVIKNSFLDIEIPCGFEPDSASQSPATNAPPKRRASTLEDIEDQLSQAHTKADDVAESTTDNRSSCPNGDSLQSSPVYATQDPADAGDDVEICSQGTADSETEITPAEWQATGMNPNWYMENDYYAEAMAMGMMPVFMMPMMQMPYFCPDGAAAWHELNGRPKFNKHGKGSGKANGKNNDNDKRQKQKRAPKNSKHGGKKQDYHEGDSEYAAACLQSGNAPAFSEYQEDVSPTPEWQDEKAFPELGGKLLQEADGKKQPMWWPMGAGAAASPTRPEASSSSGSKPAATARAATAASAFQNARTRAVAAAQACATTMLGKEKPKVDSSEANQEQLHDQPVLPSEVEGAGKSPAASNARRLPPAPRYLPPPVPLDEQPSKSTSSKPRVVKEVPHERNEHNCPERIPSSNTEDVRNPEDHHPPNGGDAFSCASSDGTNTGGWENLTLDSRCNSSVSTLIPEEMNDHKAYITWNSFGDAGGKRQDAAMIARLRKMPNKAIAILHTPPPAGSAPMPPEDEDTDVTDVLPVFPDVTTCSEVEEPSTASVEVPTVEVVQRVSRSAGKKADVRPAVQPMQVLTTPVKPSLVSEQNRSPRRNVPHIPTESQQAPAPTPVTTKTIAATTIHSPQTKLRPVNRTATEHKKTTERRQRAKLVRDDDDEVLDRELANRPGIFARLCGAMLSKSGLKFTGGAILVIGLVGGREQAQTLLSEAGPFLHEIVTSRFSTQPRNVWTMVKPGDSNVWPQGQNIAGWGHHLEVEASRAYTAGTHVREYLVQEWEKNVQEKEQQRKEKEEKRIEQMQEQWHLKQQHQADYQELQRTIMNMRTMTRPESPIVPGSPPHAGHAMHPGAPPLAGHAMYPGAPPHAGQAMYPGYPPHAGHAMHPGSIQPWNFPQQSPM